MVSNGMHMLDNYLSERSYIEGYQPSQADVLVFNAIKTIPTKATPNVYRWYAHMQSFTAEEKRDFPAIALHTEIAKFLCDEPAAADVELFGSEEADAKVDGERHPTRVTPLLITITFRDNKIDVEMLEAKIRMIKMPDLIWGISKIIPFNYGLGDKKKLQMMCCVHQDFRDNLAMEIINLKEPVDHVGFFTSDELTFMH